MDLLDLVGRMRSMLDYVLDSVGRARSALTTLEGRRQECLLSMG